MINPSAASRYVSPSLQAACSKHSSSSAVTTAALGHLPRSVSELPDDVLPPLPGSTHPSYSLSQVEPTRRSRFPRAATAGCGDPRPIHSSLDPAVPRRASLPLSEKLGRIVKNLFDSETLSHRDIVTASLQFSLLRKSSSTTEIDAYTEKVTPSIASLLKLEIQRWKEIASEKADGVLIGNQYIHLKECVSIAQDILKRYEQKETSIFVVICDKSGIILGIAQATPMEQSSPSFNTNTQRTQEGIPALKIDFLLTNPEKTQAKVGSSLIAQCILYSFEKGFKGAIELPIPESLFTEDQLRLRSFFAEDLTILPYRFPQFYQHIFAKSTISGHLKAMLPDDIEAHVYTNVIRDPSSLTSFLCKYAGYVVHKEGLCVAELPTPSTSCCLPFV